MNTHAFARVVAHIACLILLVSHLPALAKPLEDQKWIEVRTENFVVRSVLKKADTIEMAQHLEMIRKVLPQLISSIKTESSIKTDIYLLRARDFAQLGTQPRQIAGRFHQSLRRNVVLVRDTKGMRETSIIVHEYVHFLSRNQGSLNYPMWFSEGFAEYIGAADFRRGFLQIGNVPKERARSLQYSTWIPVTDILSPDRYDKWPQERKAMFYAEAWAVVHYLHNRETDGDTLTENLTQYLQLLENGGTDPEAFETAFGITASKLNQAVKRYLKAGRFAGYQAPAEKLLPNFEFTVTRLSQSQASLGLAQLALAEGELELAQRWFSLADNDPTTRPQAQAGLGDVHKFQGEFAAAEPFFLKAVELAPDDPYCQLDAAEFWHDRANRADNADQGMAYLDKARQHYIAAWKLDNTLPEVYAKYGELYMTGTQPDYEKAIEMLEEAEYLLPSHLGIRLGLATAYARAGREADARQAAQSILAWSHEDSDIAERAEKILSQLNAATN